MVVGTYRSKKSNAEPSDGIFHFFFFLEGVVCIFARHIFYYSLYNPKNLSVLSFFVAVVAVAGERGAYLLRGGARHQIQRNETKRNETKRNETERNETKAASNHIQSTDFS